MNSNTDQLVRDALRDWSDQAPHDPDLLGSVLRLADSTTTRTTHRRTTVRRLLVPALVVGATAAAVAVGVPLLNDTRSDRVDSTPGATSSLSPEEVEELTTFGRHGRNWDDAKVEQAWQQKWGVSDIGAVTDALRSAAENYPEADAGLTYDPDTLTYTQVIVKGAAQSTVLRNAVQEAFDSAAADSNLDLRFATSTTSYDAAQELMDQLGAASRNDPGWPDGLALTGDWSPAQGKFVLFAGGRANDPAAEAYFERHWPGLVLLSPETTPTLQ